MRLGLASVGIIFGFLLGGAALALEAKEIGWGDLRPSIPDLENAFVSLTETQLNDMRTHVAWRTASRSKKEDLAFKAAHEAALDRLNGAGIDVEHYMAERRKLIVAGQRAALSTNDALIGVDIRLPGYVLPLEFDGTKVTEFLLVPSVGACIHTPAPPPNQIVHVLYPDGIEIGGMFSPVWIVGELTALEKKQDVGLSDGVAAVETKYTLKADLVEDYR